MKQNLLLKWTLSVLFAVAFLPLFAQTETSCFTMSDLTTGKSSVDYRFGIKNPASDPVTWGWIKTDSAVDAHRKALMTQDSPAKDTLFETLSVLPSGKNYSIRLASPNYVTHQLNDSAKGAEMRFTYTVAADKSILLLSYAVGLELPENATFAENYPRYGQPWCAFYVVDNAGEQLNPAKVIEHYPSKATSVAGWSSVTDKRGKRAIVKDWSTVGIDMSKYVGQTVTIVMRYHDGAAKDFDAATNTLTICREKLLAHVYAYLDCAEKAFTLDCTRLTLTAPEGFNYAWTVDGMKDEINTTAIHEIPATRKENVRYFCQLSNNINCLAEDFTLDTIIYANNTTDSTSIRESELPWVWEAGKHTFVKEDMKLDSTRTYSKSVTETNTNGCDSTMTYTLTILPTKVMPTIDTVVCADLIDEDGYIWRGITWTTFDSTHVDTIPTASGDSVVTLHLSTKPCDCEEFKGTLDTDEPLCADARGLHGFLRAVQGAPASYSIVFHDKDPYGILEDLFDQPLLASVEQELFIPFVSGRIQPNTSARMTIC